MLLAVIWGSSSNSVNVVGTTLSAAEERLAVALTRTMLSWLLTLLSVAVMFQVAVVEPAEMVWVAWLLLVVSQTSPRVTDTLELSVRLSVAVMTAVPEFSLMRAGLTDSVTVGGPLVLPVGVTEDAVDQVPEPAELEARTLT